MVGTGYKGTGTTALVLMDGRQTPVGTLITAANEHEVKHLERLVHSAVVPIQHECRLLYDAAADSDELRDRLWLEGITLIAPSRKHRTKGTRQDGRKLRCLRHRWKIERTNAWLKSYGRIRHRKDHNATLFLGWLQLACLFTILKRF